MKKRLLAAGLACLLLAGCGPVRTEPVQPEPAAEGTAIAYVPLDDRPDNEERVVYLAESLGYTLVMPERDLYHTALDGQPLNSNGTQCGDRGALFQWVMEQEKTGCDRYVLSMDQLLSGGLVHSRAMFNHEDISFWEEGSNQLQTMTEYQIMGSLLSTLTTDPENRVWLLDSVMRLAPTVGYQGGTLEEYNALRAYGAQPRPQLDGAELTLAGIEESYRKGADGLELILADYELETAQATEYLAARSRKLELTDAMMEMVTGIQADNIRVLIGIDDSSEENSIQKNEIAYLRSLLRDGDALLSGVDDLAFKAVAKLYLEEVGWSGANACVRYFGGMEEQPACAYDYKPLTEIMEEHFNFFDLTATEYPAQCDFMILVLTQPADEAKKEAYYRELIQELQRKRDSNHPPVILIDASNARYGTAFHKALTKDAELGWLLSYAGALDMAIVTGTALSHGVARYAWLRHDHQNSTEVTEQAFLRTVADSILKDFCYRHIVRSEMTAYARDTLGGVGDNFWQPDIDRATLLTLLEKRMTEEAAEVIENLERSNFITALASSGGVYEERGWGGIELGNYRFPWDRAFEIGMDIRLGTSTEPHKSILGIYYQ